MLNVDIKFDTTAIKRMTAEIKAELKVYPQQALTEFKDLTPIRSGNARRRTRLSATNQAIIADYPYAERLDAGYSSQAPQGMTKPFDKWVKDKVNKIFRKR
jgi:hypothetical protein